MDVAAESTFHFDKTIAWQSIRHPAEMLHVGKRADFSTFEGFISLQGLSDLHVEMMIATLQTLHEHTGDLWKPSLCKAAIIIEQTLNKLLPQVLPEGHADVQNWRKYPLHYWTTLSHPDLPLIIIDPAGLNEGFTLPHNIPYFGTKEGCQLHGFSRSAAQLYYENGEVLSESEYEKLQNVIPMINR